MTATAGTAAGQEAPAVLDLSGAAFGYAGTPVTRGVDLQVRAGEVIALLGPNGSGKSTLVRGLLGLNDHLGGTVRLFGVPLARQRDRHRLGYVPQRHTLSGSVRSTVSEVVATGLLAARPWWRRPSRQDREAVTRALELVRLADRADSDVSTLSGGQHRRVLIARALVAGPEVLVLDEPTAGVDAAHQDVLAQVLHRLAGTGVTMLVVTHELAALRGIVKRIVEMDGGRVSFDGTPADYTAHLGALVRSAAFDPGGHHHDDEAAGPPPLFGAGPLDPGPRPEDGDWR